MCLHIVTETDNYYLCINQGAILLDLYLLYNVAQSFLTLWPHGLQHNRPPCPLPSPEVCPSSCPLHWLFHLAISSSDALLSFWPQFVPTSGTFPVCSLFTSYDQSTGTSASASVLPMNIQYSGLISFSHAQLWSKNLNNHEGMAWPSDFPPAHAPS